MFRGLIVNCNFCFSGSLSPNASPSPNLLHWRVPTLLERQQESISERLKSYKSVTELLTTKDGTPIITTILQNNPLGKWEKRGMDEEQGN